MSMTGFAGSSGTAVIFRCAQLTPQAKEQNLLQQQTLGFEPRRPRVVVGDNLYRRAAFAGRCLDKRLAHGV